MEENSIVDFREFESEQWRLLSQVSRPSRYCGSEWRPYPAGPGWENAALRVCLAFPEVYEIGMSYYGFQVIEGFIHSLGKNYLPDRAYCVWPDMEELMRAQSVPLRSVEYHRELRDFDVVGFTLPHEMVYTNILTMLDLAGLRLRSCERSELDPVVIAGGCGAYVPDVLSGFIDVFCVGEAEALLPELLETLSELRGRPRTEKLLAVSELPGMYVPSCYDGRRVKRQFTSELYSLKSMIVPSAGIVHDRAAIELFRGCSRSCRFCQAGMTNRPVRELSVSAAADSIISIINSTGWEEAGLLSLASCDYQGIEQLIDMLSDTLNSQGAKLSLPSLRMDGFSVGLAERLSGLRSHHGSITFAPEAGTQRLRDVINKGITEQMIVNCLTEIFTLGWEKVKLYFMMGLPTETSADLEAIAELSASALKLGRRLGRRRAGISVSVSGFVPKAHTPFQWERQNSITELMDKGRYVKSLMHDRSLSAAYHEPKQTFLEGVLSRGDSKTGEVILTAWLKGARFDNWTEHFNLERWLEAFSECGVDPESYTRERSETEALSWDKIDTGVSRDFLLRERHRAYEGRLTADCLSGCASCGLRCRDEN